MKNFNRHDLQQLFEEQSLSHHHRQMLLAFWEEYGEMPPYMGEGHWLLACQAAFPVVLTPDLLYRIWANFSSLEDRKPTHIPYEAVSDLLLSPILKEVGGERFEMETPIRDVLLLSLQRHEKLGTNRLYALASFLETYAEKHLNRSMDHKVQQLQKWTAQAYLKPKALAKELTRSINEYEIQKAQAEQLRIHYLMESLAVPLKDYRILLDYTRGLKASIYQEGEDLIRQYLQNLSPSGMQEVADGEMLRISQSLRQYLPRTQKTETENPDPLKQLSIGQTLEGEVQILHPAGATIQIHDFNISAFLPLKEISWFYLSNIESSGLIVGMRLKVQILRIDYEAGEVYLSRKNLLNNPWPKISKELTLGQYVKGSVVDTGKQPPGLYVDIGFGIVGYVNPSEISDGKSIGYYLNPEYWLNREVEARVLTINPEKESLQLSMRQVSGAFRVPDMTLVKGGTFMMGSPENEKGRYSNEVLHQVTLGDFYMATTPVTNAEFAVFMNWAKNRKDQKWDDAWVREKDSYFKIKYNGSVYYPEEGYENHPVVKVSWHGATAYAQWLSKRTGKTYRLPTEAEWEYAAAGGEYGYTEEGKRIYIWAGTSDISELKAYACYDNKAGKELQAVKTRKQNPLGLFDMSGNVYEWCADWYGQYPTSPQTNPKGPERGGYRVLRGGTWLNTARRVRVAYRFNGDPGNRDDVIGFRLARTVDF